MPFKAQFSFSIYCLQFAKDQTFANLMYLFPSAEECLFPYAYRLAYRLAYKLQLDYQNLAFFSTWHKICGICLK